MTKHVERARKLRRDQTDAEKRLWYHLRNRQLGGFKFRRQHPVPPYVTDFFCEELGLVVELDGGQHTPEKDAKRTEFLKEKGFEVTRFWNNDVLKNTENVLETLLNTANSLAPHPPSLREGTLSPERGKDSTQNKRICLGKITAAHGLKGLVKIRPFGEDTALLNDTLYTSDTGPDALSITLKNPMGKFWLAAIEGVDDKTKADELRGTELWLDRDKLPEPEDGEFYIEDLTGLKAEDKNGKAVGIVISVQNFGAGDLLEIQPPSGESFYIPFTKETVPDVKEGLIAVFIPENFT